MTINKTQELQDHIRSALSDKQMLQIVGGNTKHFYGNPLLHSKTKKVEVIETRIHQGIISYEPSELVLTARTGTPLKEIEALLAKNNQMLPFEPPHFGEHATLGGAIATGLSGPRRPFTGSARDFVLGVKIINGNGDLLSFGGQVIKNVAGYDVSRLMVGALGTLGLLLEVSIKVLPKPHTEITQCIGMSQQDALTTMRKLNQSPLPLSALAYENEKLYIRLGGAKSAVSSAQKKVGGENVVHGENFWLQVKEQTHPFFNTDKSADKNNSLDNNSSLWRISVPYTADIKFNENCFIDWAGALYWMHSDKSAKEIQSHAAELGGTASLFKSETNDERFMPLDAKVKQLHLNLKFKFDPYGILNYGRLYTYL